MLQIYYVYQNNNVLDNKPVISCKENVNLLWHSTLSHYLTGDNKYLFARI